MCGITGFINKDLSRSDLTRMTDILAHRGPDASGYFFDENACVGLGHRRLSILDISEAANQPFYSLDGRYVMVYNGEVYNFKEIAKKYKIDTRTSSDTEVIIEAFASAGIECVNDFNGMFALAIWDKQEERLFLIRDRLGVKPLYYSYNSGQIVFGSELKAIIPFSGVKEIDNNSVFNFLHLGYIPGEGTIYANCKKIKPGHYAVLDKNGMKIEAYWQLENKLTHECLENEKSAKKELNELIQSSVEYCLISDVPLGIFLSGGVDSSLIAAVAQSRSSIPVSTFSIAFSDEKYNESKYARQVAEHIHSDHHEFTVTEKEAIPLVEQLLNVYDEPYADSSAIPTMMLSQLTRKHVTVALSGDGGDELFMGYGFYYWAKRLSNPLVSAFRKPLGSLLRATGNNRFERASTLFEYSSDKRKKSHIFSQEQYFFTESEIKKLLNIHGALTIDEEINYHGRSLSWPEQQSFFDIKNYLPEELLVKTDRASMFYGLEVRVPLLDHRLVEFALNLSPSMKLRGNTGKYLLKQVLYDYLPPSIFDRPKWGFAVPLSRWLKADLKYLIDKYLSKQVLEECGLVNVAQVLKLKEDFFSRKDYLYMRLWALIILHKWVKEKSI
ncbi:MAG: asparagine synthase (glutamine-hydrolyzing) [Bacteroidota bacterium]